MFQVKLFPPEPEPELLEKQLSELKVSLQTTFSSYYIEEVSCYNNMLHIMARFERDIFPQEERKDLSPYLLTHTKIKKTISRGYNSGVHLYILDKRKIKILLQELNSPQKEEHESVLQS